MNEQPLVSIITSCNNGEAFVHRYFDSVLAQTYSNIELIFVNNGSADKTEEIALEYKLKLEARGIQVTYIYRENQGIGPAINTGLALFRGDYLTWPDSDDWMTPDCIEKKVRYLEEHPEKGLVLCKCAMVSEDHLDRVIGILERKDTSSGWIFEDLLTAHDIYYTPCGWMVRAKALLEMLPGREIYPSPWGQSAQMLVPVAYRYECGFIEKVLAFYFVRANSLSSMYRGSQGTFDHANWTQDILEHTLARIPMAEEKRQAYLKKVRIRCIRARFDGAAQFHKKSALEEEYQNLLRENAVSPEDRRKYLCTKYKACALAFWVFRLPGRVVGKIKRMAALGS